MFNTLALACISLNKLYKMTEWPFFILKQTHSVYLAVARRPFFGRFLDSFTEIFFANDTMSQCAFVPDLAGYVIPPNPMRKDMGEVSYISNKGFTRFRP